MRVVAFTFYVLILYIEFILLSYIFIKVAFFQNFLLLFYLIYLLYIFI